MSTATSHPLLGGLHVLQNRVLGLGIFPGAAQPWWAAPGAGGGFRTFTERVPGLRVPNVRVTLEA